MQDAFFIWRGIVSVEQVEKLFSIGVEKVVLNTSILKDYNLIKDLSYNFGSQSIVVAIDINLNIFNKNYLIGSIIKFKKISMLI